MSRDSDDRDSEASIPLRVAGELFEGRFDLLRRHTDRKEAVADPLRYAVLYTVWENEGITRADLLARASADPGLVEAALARLADVGLVASDPGPDGEGDARTRYRVTAVGRREIESDRANVLGDGA